MLLVEIFPYAFECGREQIFKTFSKMQIPLLSNHLRNELLLLFSMRQRSLIVYQSPSSQGLCGGLFNPGVLFTAAVVPDLSDLSQGL